MAGCQILPYQVRRKRLEGVVEWSSKLPKDITPSIKRRRKDLWFIDSCAMSVENLKEIASQPKPAVCVCHGVRRSRRLAKNTAETCSCRVEKENAKSKAKSTSKLEGSNDALLVTWGMELRSQKHRLTPLKKSSVVCKKTATPKTRQHVPATVSPTTELSSKLAGVEFFQGDSPSSQLTPSPRKSPLKEIQDTCSVESVQLSPAADQTVEDDVCTSAIGPVVHQKMNSPGRPLDTEVPILSVATEESRVDKPDEDADKHMSGDTLLCRDDEIASLEAFLKRHIVGKRPGSLYVSGPPGTGKSASVNHVIRNKVTEELQNAVVININCMSLRSPQVLYSVLVEETRGQQDRKKKGKKSVKPSHLQDYLRDVVCTSTKMILLVLDEMDQLDSRGQEILYSVFEWPSLPKSKLVLIGIANALDLTDRILPRLQMRPGCSPELLHFAPYDKDQLVTILSNKMPTITSHSVLFDDKAIQFCARKVSAVHGDLRKAVDICRRAAEITEGKGTDPNADLKVTIPVVAKVVSEVYGSSIDRSGEGLPLQQKIAICSFLLLTQGRKKKEVELGRFHEAYVKVCHKRKLKYESQQEFVDLCSLLETRGIFSVKTAKEKRLAKITLSLQENDVEYALQDKALLSSVLQEGL